LFSSQRGVEVSKESVFPSRGVCQPDLKLLPGSARHERGEWDRQKGLWHNSKGLVEVLVGLVRAVDGEVDVISLLGGEDGQVSAQLAQVEASDFLVQLLGEDVDAEFGW
jgi:hypothetical protein